MSPRKTKRVGSNSPTGRHYKSAKVHYKMTIYRDQPWGDVFDLTADPEERHNRFNDPDYADIKAQLALRFLNAELSREPMRFDRIAGA